MTEYANELLSATGENLSNGVQRIALTRWLQSNEKGSTHLFTRKCQRELWDEVFKYLDSTNDSHAIITGNPGVGKSRSMVYFLRFLLQNNKTFIFESRRDEIVYAFIPPNGNEDGSTNYMVWSCESRKFSHMKCLILKNPHNYYLIDMTRDSIKITEVVAHIVLSASPIIFSRIKDFTGRTDYACLEKRGTRHNKTIFPSGAKGSERRRLSESIPLFWWETTICFHIAP
jgi:hypothetical protein